MFVSTPNLSFYSILWGLFTLVPIIHVNSETYAFSLRERMTVENTNSAKQLWVD